jgi:hypothetical protein
VLVAMLWLRLFALWVISVLLGLMNHYLAWLAHLRTLHDRSPAEHALAAHIVLLPQLIRLVLLDTIALWETSHLSSFLVPPDLSVTPLGLTAHLNASIAPPANIAMGKD